jgi:penicillin-binding protein 2
MIISLGIGQGELLITPLQMANLATIIANRGFYYIPHFAKEFKNADNDLLLKKYREKQNSSIDAEHFTHVVNGMEQVVIAGTARVAFLPDIPICGKTGTVQNPHGKDHSTFIAFAPKDNPKIAMAVFVENAGFGAEYAAPIASLMIEKYLTRTIRKERKYLEERMMNANLIDP